MSQAPLQGCWPRLGVVWRGGPYFQGEEVVRHEPLSICSGTFHSNKQLMKPVFLRISLPQEPEPGMKNGGQPLHIFHIYSLTSSASVSSVAQLCPTLCDPMNHRTPGLPVHHQLPEFTQIHAHQVSDAIQPSHPLSPPSPPAPNPSQHQGLFQ